MVEYNTLGSWQRAREIVGVLGSPQRVVRSCVRFLQTDFETGTPVRSVSEMLLQSLLRLPSVKACFYYLNLTLFPDKFREGHKPDADSLLLLYGLDGVATTLALLHLYRRAKSNCDSQLWVELSHELHLRAEIGARLGHAIPRIGLSYGFLLATIQPLAHLVMAGLKPDEFSGYRQFLHDQGDLYDYELETYTWGATSLQIAAIMIQSIGLGLPVATTIGQELNSINFYEEDLDPLAIRLRIALSWLRTLIQHSKVPDIKHKGEYYPKEEDLNRLLAVCKELKQDGVQYEWFKVASIRAKHDPDDSHLNMLDQEQIDRLLAGIEVSS